MAEREPTRDTISFANSAIVTSLGLSRLTGFDASPSTFISRTSPPDQIIDITERSRLAAVSVDRDWFVGERLDDEVRHGATILRMHAWSVGVENAGDASLQPMLPFVVGEQRLGATPTFVVATTRAVEVDETTIVFGLRVYIGVSIHLAGRRLQGYVHAAAWPD
jgi:hypothetical protein